MSSAFFMLRILKKKLRSKQLSNKQCSPSSNVEKCVTNEVSKCRVCMQEASIPIFNEDGPFNIAEAIRTFGGIILSVLDDYPKHICTTCYSFLANAVSFRKSAQDTDKMLRNTSIKSCDDLNPVEKANYTTNNDAHLKSYTCKFCKLHFQSWGELIVHKNSKCHKNICIQKNIRIQCPICHGLLTAHLYKKHLETHQSSIHIVCDICGKLYRKDNLVRHLQSHNYELPFQCQVCPYRGRFMESLKIHMRTHTGERPYSCDNCELRFLTRSNLTRHLLTHKKEKPFVCAECGKSFHIKKDMANHFLDDHSGLNYTCELCENKYRNKKALMRHELRVHKRNKMGKGRVPLYMQAEYQNY